VNRVLPKDMTEDAKRLKKGEVTVRRNQELLLISHQDKRLINMISTRRRAEVIETRGRRTGVAKKKPKCVIDYKSHTHGVETADRGWLSTHSFVKVLSGLRKYHFFYLLQCCLFNSYATFSKNNPNSRK